ncbi:hypothetical protein [Metabacillus halosaccharovorans]|uniref:Uncharacterized protein n=1 Tax=Metabacillus halosaccharovorans TaxID=930124 RepID=A0ABT3DCA2_9BACI|nr:hypothetical protein [Metabacillus halosaccharovorans]MCV9884689.1 hypothetical protein [Metabacillus halosaccharovorans]
MTKEINIVNLHNAEEATLRAHHSYKMMRRYKDGVYKQNPEQLEKDLAENARLNCDLSGVSFSDLAS